MSRMRFYMAGSGNLGKWFPNDQARDMYTSLYSGGVRFLDLSTSEQEMVSKWEGPGFIKRKEDQVLPQVPIFTDSDQSALSTWFAKNVDRAVRVTSSRSAEYQYLADELSDNGRVPRDHLFTILICGHTLDVGTLNKLQSGILGDPPNRGEDDAYFIWGESTTRDLKNYYGVNSYGILRAFALSVMWSPEIKRAIPNQKSLTIPVFSQAEMEKVQTLCTGTSEELAEIFSESVSDLKRSLNDCSFRDCPLNDILCMLFHIGYGLITDALVESKTLPEFPRIADDSWGIWIHS